MSLVNLCPGSQASATQSGSSHSLRYKVFLHELIHALGFGNPLFFEQLMVAPPALEGLRSETTLTKAHAVLAYSRAHYGCDYIQGVPLIRGHWDPFFVGDREIMAPCVSEQSLLTPYTLGALASLGPYVVSNLSVLSQVTR